MTEEGAHRVVSCTGSMCIRLANALVVSHTEGAQAMSVLPLDAADLTPELAPLLRGYQPEMLYGFCSFVACVAPFVEEECSRGIKAVKFSGESLKDDYAERFAAQFPHAEQTELYIANEVGGHIATRTCPHLPKRHFHPAAEVKIELANIGEDGVGDIVISKKVFRDLRTDRYLVGDIGRLIEKPCACGAAMTLELLGRKGIDYVKLAGALLRREEFDRVAALFPHAIHDYRVQAKEVIQDGAAKGAITLMVYYSGGTFGEKLLEEIRRTFEENLFLSADHTLKEFIARGAFVPLTVAFSNGPFKEGHKDVKLSLVR